MEKQYNNSTIQNEGTAELDEMRRQLSEMKEQLDGQEIINERLIAESMSGKMSWIKKLVWIEIASLPFIFLLWIFIKEWLQLSWANVLFMFAMCIIDVWFDYRINVKGISDDDYMRSNLVATINKLVTMKRRRGLQTLIMVSVLVAWLVWTGIEAFSHVPLNADTIENAAMVGGLAGMCIGAVAGIIAAIVIFRKMQRTNDELISQIKDL